MENEAVASMSAISISTVVYDLRQPKFIKQMMWALAFWLIAVISILLNVEYLKTTYPDPAEPPDRILDAIPETKAFITVGEIFSMLEVVAVLAAFAQIRFEGAPKLVFLVAVMFTLRGFTMTLTPLAQIQPPSVNYPEEHIFAQAFYHGMFFSGHTASAFMQAFFFKGHRLRPLIFLFASIQAFSLLASHSHYTIDVFGGFFVAYFMTHFDFMRLVPKQVQDIQWMPWNIQ